MRKLTNRALFICFALMTSFCLIAPATALRSYAQEGGGSTLEGLIKDDSGPLLGATVIVKNTTRGTTTDMDGKFRLEGLQPGDVLQVTYVGYDPYEVTYTGQTTLDILMTTTANQLNAVVVTAMGIERQSKTLSYAAETVGGDDVADIKSVNMINALQGKAAGLQITPNSTGAGGSSKILFRGNKSINGSNQPLVVVDGVPLMMNITSEQVNSNWGAQRDGGDAMSTINPDDIASISLLKGASAAARPLTPRSRCPNSRTHTGRTANTVGATNSRRRLPITPRSSSVRAGRPTTRSRSTAAPKTCEPTSPTAT